MLTFQTLRYQFVSLIAGAIALALSEHGALADDVTQCAKRYGFVVAETMTDLQRDQHRALNARFQWLEDQLDIRSIRTTMVELKVAYKVDAPIFAECLGAAVTKQLSYRAVQYILIPPRDAQELARGAGSAATFNVLSIAFRLDASDDQYRSPYDRILNGVRRAAEAMAALYPNIRRDDFLPPPKAQAVVNGPSRSRLPSANMQWAAAADAYDATFSRLMAVFPTGKGGFESDRKFNHTLAVALEDKKYRPCEGSLAACEAECIKDGAKCAALEYDTSNRTGGLFESAILSQETAPAYVVSVKIQP